MQDMKFFLDGLPYFKDLNQQDLDELSTLFMERKYERGVDVFQEYGEGNELFFIQSGAVKIYRTDDSREIILAILGFGDLFGEMAVLQEQYPRSASAKTMEPSTFFVLKRRDFLSLINKSPQIAIRILQAALDRLRRANEFITDLTTLDARTRIARGLLRLTEKHGIRKEGGIAIDIRLTHQQIADLTGTVRETVTKVLLDMQLQEAITITKKKIIILDIGKLEQFAGASNDGMP